ncbi:MAG: patatin-like phospholipase family protein [Acidimicrobiia bacterium]|nr:patatin-like phospholipase family protein [Acidimicrobiia bacterium]
MTTAFVLSGGGSLGSVQAGMVLALAERDIVPDLVVGTSVGAVNAGWLAGNPGRDGAIALADAWRSIRRNDVFPNDLRGVLGFVGRRDHLVSARGLRAILRRHLAFERLEDAPTPIRVVATDILTGEEVVLTEGDAVDAISASAAIPGVFRPVTISDRVLVDGAVANNVPITHAVHAGATKIYVLPTGYACALSQSPKTALGVAIQALTLMLAQGLARDVERFENEVEIVVLPPLCPLDVSPVDFSHTDELIERARASSGEWLDKDHTMPPHALLDLHRH